MIPGVASETIKSNIKAWDYFRLKAVCLIICRLDKDFGSLLTCCRFTAFMFIQQWKRPIFDKVQNAW